MFTVESVRFSNREAAEIYASIESFLMQRRVIVMDDSIAHQLNLMSGSSNYSVSGYAAVGNIFQPQPALSREEWMQAVRNIF